MATINSREPDAASQKVPSASTTKYEPIGICDEVVEEMASKLYNQETIARRFKISVNTLMDLYGPAYHKGALSVLDTPKAYRMRILKDLMAWGDYEDPMTGRKNNWADKDAPYDRLVTLIEKMESKYEAKPKVEVEELKGGVMIVPLQKGDDAV